MFLDKTEMQYHIVFLCNIACNYTDILLLAVSNIASYWLITIHFECILILYSALI